MLDQVFELLQTSLTSGRILNETSVSNHPHVSAAKPGGEGYAFEETLKKKGDSLNLSIRQDLRQDSRNRLEVVRRLHRLTLAKCSQNIDTRALSVGAVSHSAARAHHACHRPEITAKRRLQLQVDTA